MSFSGDQFSRALQPNLRFPEMEIRLFDRKGKRCIQESGTQEQWNSLEDYTQSLGALCPPLLSFQHNIIEEKVKSLPRFYDSSFCLDVFVEVCKYLSYPAYHGFVFTLFSDFRGTYLPPFQIILLCLSCIYEILDIIQRSHLKMPKSTQA